MRLPMCVGMARMAMAMLALTGCTQAERHDPVFVSQEALTPPAPQRPVYVAASDEGDVDLSPLTGAQRAVDGSGLGAWSAPASYTSAFTARSGMSTGVYDAQAYFVGGTDANGPLTDVWIVGFLPNGGIDPTTAVQGTSLPGSGLSQHAGVAYAANLYVAGGYDPGNGVALGAVMVSPLDIDGSMGAWATTTPLPGLRANPAMVAHDGALYVIGGDNGGSTLYPDVFRAALNPDGTLGSWTAVTSLPVATTGAAAAVFGDSLYVLGGQTAGGASANVEVATFQSDGTLSSWVTLPSFTGARTHARAAATRGNLFLVGGNGVSDVQSAPIEPNGNLGTWAEMPGFPAVRGSFALVESQGVLTAVGGTNGSNPYGDSLYASVATYGVRGNWQDAGTLAAGSAAAAVVFNGFVYLVAGPSPGDSTDVQFAALGPDATPGTFSSAETGGPLPVALSYAGAIGYNGYLYVIGGNNTLSISKAPFLTAGGLGAWVDAGTLPESDSIFQPVISDGQLFLAGTANLGGGVTPNSQIDETTIAADGTLGTWSALTRSGGGYSAQFNAGTFAARGNLYILGGIADGSSGYPEGGVFANVCSTIVQYAPITPSGLGALTQIQLPSNQYTCGRMATYDDYWFLEGLISGWGASGPVIADGGVPLQDGYGQAPESTQMEGYGAYNGSLLILGGFRGTGTTTGIYTAPLGLPGALGPWTLSTAMSGLTETTNRTGGVAVSNRGWIYVVGGFGSKGVSLNDVVVAAAYTDGGVGTWQASPDTFTTGRTGHAVAVMNDQLYVAGGLSDAPAVLSDVQVAPLYSDGGVGVFTPAGTLPMGVGRTNLSLVATSTALYAIGGLNSGGNALSSVATAAIGAGGTLGAWTNTGAGSFLKQPRENHTSLVHNGYVYVIGGDNVTSLLNSVEVAPLSATSGLGAFTTTTDLSVGRVGHGLAAYGGSSTSWVGARTWAARSSRFRALLCCRVCSRRRSWAMGRSADGRRWPASPAATRRGWEWR